MAKVIIPTAPPDADALAVAAALRLQGHVCDILYTSDYPREAHQTLSFGEATGVQFRCLRGGPSDWEYDICWLRDLHPPLVNLEDVHPDDQAFVRSIGRHYYFQHWSLLTSRMLQAGPCFYANPLEAARRAESKPLQLHLAQMAGFSVPKTIVSNDPDEIRRFLMCNRDGVIRKSLYPHYWHEGDVSVTNNTTRISENDLPGDVALSLHAEIYQAEVKKVAEVRVVFFGKTYFALRINPEKDKAHRFVDWRVYHHPGLAKLDRIKLPDEIFNSCLQLMSMLGIVTASFDLLLDEAENYIFAELNQGGCFLWMEVYGLPVLQAFTDFLVSESSEFCWDESKCDPLSWTYVVGTGEFKELNRLERSHLIPPRQMDNSSSGII